MGYARGVHRFDFDGRYAYISPTMDGYVGNIMMILDLKDPARPEEVGRWWMPGQWIAGGETPTWKGAAHRCHHPLRYGQPALYELLARRVRHPRHRRHDEAEDACPASNWTSAVSVADAHVPAHAVQDRESRHHGRHRRGRDPPRRLPAAPGGIPVDRRHHRREASDTDLDIPDSRTFRPRSSRI